MTKLPRKTALVTTLAAAFTGTMPMAASAACITFDGSGNANITACTNNVTITGALTGTLINSGTIHAAGTVAGVQNGTGNAIGAVSNSGSILSARRGIDNEGTIGQLVNTAGGTIYASSNRGQAISNNGTITSVLNQGLLKVDSTTSNTDGAGGTSLPANPMGIANYQTIGNIGNSGTISISGASATGIYSRGTIGSISNSGRIQVTGASAAAIDNSGGTLGSLSNTGILTATGSGSNGVFNTGTLSTLVNTNVISANGANSRGVYNGTTGTITTLSNSGVISGSTGVYNKNVIGTLGNSGTITGGNYAIENTASGNIGVLANTGVIAGNIQNLSTNGLTISGGAGSAFGTLTGLGGAIGSIASSGANVVFSAGNELLNDNITVGAGNTVSNLGGTLQVNNPITITGNYSQSASASLRIGSAGTSAYGKLSVTNTATFNAGASLIVDAANIGTLTNGLTLGNVISAGTLNASTFNVTDNSALFNFTAVASGNAINLNIASASSSGVYDAAKAYGLTPALGGAQVLDTQVNGAPTGDMVNVVTALGQLPDQGSVARAAAQTLPANSGNQAIMDALSSINHIVSDRLAPGGTGLSTGDAVANKHVWVKPFGSHASQNDENGASGFSSNTWGLAVGAEGDWDTTRLGLAYAYANTHVNGNTALSGTGANTQVNSNVLTFYGSRPVHGLMLDFQADTGWNDNSSQRGLNFGNLNRTATGSYGTWSAHVGTGLSKVLPLSPDMAFIPGIRVDYTRLQSQSYSESGAGALNLNVNANTVQSLVLGADARLVSKIGERGKLSAHVGVGYDTINDPGNIVAAYAGAPGQSFTTPGLQHSPWLMTAGLGYDYRTERGTNISLRYDVQGRSGFVNQSASINVSWVF